MFALYRLALEQRYRKARSAPKGAVQPMAKSSYNALGISNYAKISIDWRTSKTKVVFVKNIQDVYKVSAIALSIIALFVVGVVLYQLQSVLLPFFLAVFLSYIFKPVVLYLERKKVPMVLSLFAVLAVVALLVFGLSLLVYSSGNSFANALPRYEERFTTMLTQATTMAERMTKEWNIDISEYAWTDVIQLSSITTVVTQSVGSFFTYLGNFVLVMLFMFFILAGSGQMAEKIKNAFSVEQAGQLASIIENIDKQVRQYLFAKTLISLATGALTWLVLVLFGVDFPLLWGFLTFLLNFIPNIGSVIATVFPVLLAFLQFDSPTRPLIVLVLLIAAQNIIGNVLEPKLLARSLNLSPLLVLVSLMFWGWLWGLWGMVLAVPVTSMIKIICENVDALQPIAALMSGTVPQKQAATTTP